MTDRLRCRPCGKTYRVADAPRTPRCKACGEPLEPVVADSGADDAAAERERRAAVKQANAERLRWRKQHRAFKGYFVYAPGVILVGLMLALAIVSWRFGEWTAAWIYTIAVGVACAATWYLGRLADAKPIVATTIFAGVATLAAAPPVLAVLTARLHPMRAVLPVTICAVTWVGVGRARKAERILRELPEAYRRKHGLERAQLRGESVHEQHEDTQRDVRRRESGRKAIVFGGVCGVALLVLAVLWFLNRPPDYGPTVHSFMSAWEAGDVEAAAALGRSDRIERGLRRLWRRKDWAASPPEFEGWEVVDRGSDRVEVRYDLKDGRSSGAVWEYQGGRWALTVFAAPK